MTDTTRLRRAIEPILERCLDFFGVDDLDPESSEAMPVVIKNRWVYELVAALSEEAAVPLDVTESDPIETFAHPFLAPIVVAGHQFFHTSDCDWGAADTPSSDAPERPA